MKKLLKIIFILIAILAIALIITTNYTYCTIETSNIAPVSSRSSTMIFSILRIISVLSFFITTPIGIVYLVKSKASKGKRITLGIIILAIPTILWIATSIIRTIVVTFE